MTESPPADPPARQWMIRVSGMAGPADRAYAFFGPFPSAEEMETFYDILISRAPYCSAIRTELLPPDVRLIDAAIDGGMQF